MEQLSEYIQIVIGQLRTEYEREKRLKNNIMKHIDISDLCYFYIIFGILPEINI